MNFVKFFTLLFLGSLLATGTLQAADAMLFGGGTYIRDSNLNQNSETSVQVTIKKINKNLNPAKDVTDASGFIKLVSTYGGPFLGQPDPNTNFLSEIEVDCVDVISFDNQTGDYKMYISGTKVAPSNTIFVNRPTADGKFYSAIVPTATDHIAGLLERVNGQVSRSDWNTGHENCIGIGQADLASQGDGSRQAFLDCEDPAEWAAHYPPACNSPTLQAKFVNGDRDLSGNIFLEK